jgi:hypothetical protein
VCGTGHRRLRNIAIATVVGLPASCLADAWMLIGTTGEMPDRIVSYANSTSRSDVADPGAKVAEIMKDHNPKTIEARVRQLRNVQMTVVQVFESPKAPAMLRIQAVFDCGTVKQFKISHAEAIARNKVRHRSSRPAWQPVPPTGWISRAHFVACDEEIWQRPASEDFAYMRTNPTNRQADKLKLPAHGIALVGDWSPFEGLEIIQFTWKTSFPESTYVAFNDVRSASEEKAYQAFLAEEAAAREQARTLAPKVESAIAGVEGALRGLDRESEFQSEIANNFRKHKSSYYGTLKGLTEEQLVEVRGAPNSVSTHGNLRLLVYRRTTDNRQAVTIRDGRGNPVGADVVGQVLNCQVTFRLRVGGNRPEFRVVDYEVNRDMSSHGIAACD